MDITGQGESEKFDRSSPVHTTLHTIRPAFSARILPLHPRSRGGGRERGAEEKISFLFHHFCPICSINIVCIAGIVF